MDRASSTAAPAARACASTSTTCRTAAPSASGPLLQQAFTGRSTPALTTQAPSLAPGTPAGTDHLAAARSSRSHAAGRARPRSWSSRPRRRRRSSRAPARPGRPGGIVRNIQVVADKDNNTLLIVATPAEWTVIEAALRKLDVAGAPGDDRDGDRRGVAHRRFPVRRRVVLQERRQPGRRQLPPRHGARATSSARSLGTAAGVAGAGLGARVPGFNYLLVRACSPGGIQAALSLLGTAGNTKIVANPHVAALDNQRSTIKVGDRIPISQQTLVGGTTNAVTTTSQYIDTGVLVRGDAAHQRRRARHDGHPGRGEQPGRRRRRRRGAADQHALAAVDRRRAERRHADHGRADPRHQDSRAPRASRCSRKIPVIGGLFGAAERSRTSARSSCCSSRRASSRRSPTSATSSTTCAERMERLHDIFPTRIGDPAGVPGPRRA